MEDKEHSLLPSLSAPSMCPLHIVPHSRPEAPVLGCQVAAGPGTTWERPDLSGIGQHRGGREARELVPVGDRDGERDQGQRNKEERRKRREGEGRENPI